MREFTVLMPIGRIEVGVPVDRAAWPLHLTIQPNVRSDAPVEVVIAAVGAAAAEIRTVTTVAGEEARFGADGSIVVNLVPATDLRAAHDVVNARLRSEARAAPIMPDFDGDGYRAHVTATGPGRVHDGDRLVLRRIVLVEVGPGGDRRIAMPIAEFELHD